MVRKKVELFRGPIDRRRVRCVACQKDFLPLLRYCPFCGHSNEEINFWKLDPEARQVFVELWVEPGLHIVAEDRAIDEGLTVEALYERAMEFYLSEQAKAKRN